MCTPPPGPTARLIWLYGNSKAVFRREEDDPKHQMRYIEPIIGLFHLQMCMLGTIYRAHWGDEDAREPASIKRFAKMLGKPAIIAPKPKDFRAYDRFFNDMLDAYVIAFAAEMLGADTVELFHQRLRDTDWRMLIKEMVESIFPVTEGLSVVRRMRTNGEDGEDIALQDRDVLHENLKLFLQQGLPYRDFSTAVKAGDSGRLEHIIRLWATQLHGTQNINYPRELVHMLACFEKIWSPEMRDLWRHNCLVNPSGRRGAWMPDDLFGEYVVREIKAKIHPSSNSMSDKHLTQTISRQVMSLYASKVTMRRECRAHDYGQHSTLVRSSVDVAHMTRTLLKEEVGIFKPGRYRDEGRDKPYWEAHDLLGTGAVKLASGLPLQRYKLRARFNWSAGDSSSDDIDIDDPRSRGGGLDGLEASLDDLL